MSQLERRFGPPGRDTALLPVELAQLSMPAWLTSNDGLFSTLVRRKKDLCAARVVIGHLAMANADLFEDENTVALPADFVFSWERWFVRRPGRLEPFAEALGEAYSTSKPPMSPSRRLFAERQATGRQRNRGQPIPPMMSEGRAVYHATVLVYPEFLPPGSFRGGHLVALFANIAPAYRQTYLIPHQYWPADLLATWSE